MFKMLLFMALNTALFLNEYGSGASSLIQSYHISAHWFRFNWLITGFSWTIQLPDVSIVKSRNWYTIWIKKKSYCVIKYCSPNKLYDYQNVFTEKNILPSVTNSL